MIRVLTVESEEESATRLGFPLIIRINLVESYEKDVVIRWGNSQLSCGKDGQTKEFPQSINTHAAIRLNCKKQKALSTMSLVVNTPEIWEAGDKVPDKQIVVYRPIHHSSGNGFNVVKGPFKVEEDYYATSWIPSTEEFRVWFCGDKTMCGQRTSSKEHPEPYPCRSMWGYTFCDSVSEKLHYDTLAAAKSIGLECGAADVMYHDKKYWFLELNSAPTIDKQSIEDFYKQNLTKLINKKYQVK